jgi:aquaporin Z
MAEASAYVSEFIGTFLLIFTVGCNVLSEQALWGAVSIACVLMVSIYALAPVSGANFNPAVSISLALSKKLNWATAGAYCAVQIIAGLTASLCYSALFWDSFYLAPSKGYGWLNACLCEFLYTFMLCFVVLNAAASKANADKHQFYGLAIGFVIVAGAYGAGAVSGGCFNPAVAIAIDVGSLRIGWCVAYVIAEILGAAMAAGLFRVVRPGDFDGSAEDPPEHEMKSKLVAEFLGTYFLIVTVGLNVMAKSKAGAFSIAAALMCMIFALGDVSGANFNPAVTTALLACHKIDGKTASLYIFTQLFAGFCAAVTYLVVYTGKGFPLGPSEGWTWAAVGVAEGTFTFVLCFIVLCVVCSPKNNLSEFFGLAIGSCVTVGGFAIGSISGGSLNPAVSFGIAFGDYGRSLGAAIMYSIFEIIGGLIAVAAFKMTHGVEDDKKKELPA